MGQGTPKEAFAGELPSTAAAEEALEEETNKEEEEAMQALSVIDTKKTGYSRSTALFRRCVPGRGFPRHRFCKRRLQASILRRPRVGLAPGNEPNYVLPNFTKKNRNTPPPRPVSTGLHARAPQPLLQAGRVSRLSRSGGGHLQEGVRISDRAKAKGEIYFTVYSFAWEMERACVRLSGPVKSGTPW